MSSPSPPVGPFLLHRLVELGAATGDEALLLAREFNVLTFADLHAAFADNRAARLPQELRKRLARASIALDAGMRPLTLGRAYDLLTRVADVLQTCCPDVADVTFGGDTRRFEPLVNGLVLVARAIDPAAAFDALCGSPDVEKVLYRTHRRLLVSTQQAEVDVRIAAPDEFGTLLFTTTGSPDHVRAITHGRPVPLVAREKDLYARLGLSWVPPELRHDTGEVETARSGDLPRLVERSDIRGDLHMHSTYSDGQDSIEQMVAAAVALGYEYVAITDHSESAAAARTVTLDQLARQRDEIERIRQRHPGITILHGIEADILPDGRLDFADAILERLDIVLASLHDPARQDGPTLTRRCIAAMRHPLVNVITHPANRLVGRRAGYPMDYAALYAAAVATGTALEIDGAPSHLDLDGEHAREAAVAGVTLAINSDCHRAGALDRQMRLGIGTARRGWVEARHVLNCRGINEVRAFVQAKRQRRGAC